MRKSEAEKMFDKHEETQIEWQSTESQTSRFSDFMTTWKKEGTNLQPEVVEFS
jgi:hypothetical protein